MIKQAVLGMTGTALAAGVFGLGPLSSLEAQAKSVGEKAAAQVAQYEATQLAHAASIYRQAEYPNALEQAASETKGVTYTDGIAHVAIRGPFGIASCRRIDEKFTITEEPCPEPTTNEEQLSDIPAIIEDVAKTPSATVSGE